jgi:hypothetical protein
MEVFLTAFNKNWIFTGTKSIDNVLNIPEVKA